MARILGLLALVGLFIFQGALVAQGKTLYIASDMTGRLVDGAGVPAVGVTVTRTWQTQSESGTETTTTDAEGRFSFEAVTRRQSFLGGLFPSTPAIDAHFTHNRDGDATLFLRLVKLSYAPNSELSGRPIKVVCRVDQPAESGPGPIVRSTCRIED